jgi:hypothetical protein
MKEGHAMWIARCLIYLAGAIVGIAYALDAPLWHGAALVAVIMAPILATVAWDYYRLRRAAGLRGD